MEHWQIIKMKNLGLKYTVPGSEKILHGPGWDQTHICMVAERLNDI